MRLVRGAPGAGKTALVFREFKQALQAGERALIVVPTATLVRHFQHELARDGVVFSPHLIVSLGRLAGASSNGLVLRTAIREELRNGKYPEFAGVAETDGLIETVAANIALFENAAATPDRVAAIRKTGPHATAFVRLWKAVDGQLRARKIENRVDTVRAVAADAPTGKVWMDGFLSFSPLEWELVRAMAQSADVTLTLPDSSAFGDIRRLAMGLGAKDEPLYGAGRKPERTVVEAASPERETDEIARRVLRMHEQGMALREIGVAIRDTAVYLPLLKTAFERLHIPARYYFSDALAQHPAASFLNGIVTNSLNGWEFAEALATLRAHPAWGRTGWFDRFDFKVREAMPGRGGDALMARCEPKHARELAACVEAFHREGNARAKDWVYRLTAMAQAMYKPGMIGVAEDARELASARSWAAGLRAWTEAVTAAAECWASPEESVSLAQFWEIAQESVRTAALPLRDDRGDVVHVMNAFEARQWNVDALFICGMSSRDYPKKPSPNLLFTEAELERIANAGVKVRRAADAEQQENALLVSLESRAAKTTVMSYSTHDASGRASERSLYIADSGIAPETAKTFAVAPLLQAPGAGLTGTIQHPELLQRLTAQHLELTASTVEDMAQCRFKFFAAKSLGLRPRPERPRERLSAGTLGNILHKAMEVWMGRNREGSLPDVFDEEFEKTAQQKHLPPGYDLEVERYRWRQFASKLSGADKWPYLSTEQEVELVATLPGGVKVKCRIDRLDLLPGDECIVVDYKSGGVQNIKNNTKNPAKLQGPLYALAAQQQRGLKTAAMMYIAVRTEQYFGWGHVEGLAVPLESMPADWMEAGRDRAEERLQSFLAGQIHAEPADEAQCRWCDFSSGCRVKERRGLAAIAEGAHGA